MVARAQLATAMAFRDQRRRAGVALPGYGPSRVMADAAFSPGFHTAGELALGLVLFALLGIAVAVILARAVGSHARAVPVAPGRWP